MIFLSICENKLIYEEVMLFDRRPVYGTPKIVRGIGI